MKFRIAEKTFEYTPKYDRGGTEELFHDFLIDENESVDFKIDDNSMKESRHFLENLDYEFTPEELEAGALQFTLIDLLRPFGNLFLHSAAVVVDGEAYAFTGNSGIGKSTQCNLWLKHFGKRAYILNGDKLFYHRDNCKWTAYDTPWRGKEHLGVNGKAPLKGIIYLSQASENQIEDMTPGEKVERLIPQTYLPKQQDGMILQLQLLDDFVREVPGYSLKCTISDEAVRLAYQKFNSNSKIHKM